HYRDTAARSTGTSGRGLCAHVILIFRALEYEKQIVGGHFPRFRMAPGRREASFSRLRCETGLATSSCVEHPHCQPMAFMLLTTYIGATVHQKNVRKTPLIATSSIKWALVSALMIGVAALDCPARAQSAAAAGQQIAFD